MVFYIGVHLPQNFSDSSYELSIKWPIDDRKVTNFKVTFALQIAESRWLARQAKITWCMSVKSFTHTGYILVGIFMGCLDNTPLRGTVAERGRWNIGKCEYEKRKYKAGHFARLENASTENSSK